MDDVSKRLVHDYLNRVIYKRVAEVPFLRLEGNLADLRKLFGWRQRRKHLQLIADDLKQKARKKIENSSCLFVSLNKDPAEALLYLESSTTQPLLVDLPLRDLGLGGSPPPVLKDISRKRGEYAQEDTPREIVGHIWKDGIKTMMAEISVCRLYCEPQFYDILSGTLTQADIEASIKKFVPWGAPE